MHVQSFLCPFAHAVSLCVNVFLLLLTYYFHSSQPNLLFIFSIFIGIVALHWYVSFCSIAKVSHICIYIYPLLDFLSQIRVRYVLYRRFLLVICFIHNSVFMSVPISQFSPALSSWYSRVCLVHLCLSSAFQIRASVPFF